MRILKGVYFQYTASFFISNKNVGENFVCCLMDCLMESMKTPAPSINVLCCLISHFDCLIWRFMKPCCYKEVFKKLGYKKVEHDRPRVEHDRPRVEHDRPRVEPDIYLQF